MRLSEGIARGRAKCPEYVRAKAYYDETIMDMHHRILGVDSLGAAHLGFYDSFKSFNGRPSVNAERISHDLLRAYWVLGERLSSRPKLMAALATTLKLPLVLEDYKYLTVAGAIGRAQQSSAYNEADLIKVLAAEGL